jgi:benzoyl-CoA reductase/2-hydroxyglutaryl-CoA dehydratase subunit BcrC/BadD/HgdB
MRKHPDGTLYPDHGVFRKWPLASEDEVKEHLAAVKKAHVAESKLAPVVAESNEVKELKAEIARLKGEPKPKVEEKAEEPTKDPDACDSLEEAIAVVNTMTAEECNVYAERLGMPMFGARVRIADKRKAIVDKMQEIAAESDAASGSGEAGDGE